MGLDSNLFQLGLTVFGASQLKKIYSEQMLQETKNFLGDYLFKKYQWLDNYEQCTSTLEKSNQILDRAKDSFESYKNTWVTDLNYSIMKIEPEEKH